MTQEEKQLLLKDLCARLPYHPTVKIYNDSWEGCKIGEFDNSLYYHHAEAFACDRIEINPYLRSMSSMTEEEKIEFSIFIGKTEMYVQEICLDADSMINPIIGGRKCVYWGLFDKCIDWLNAHHFDYRGLIPMGLALEVPKYMYKTE